MERTLKKPQKMTQLGGGREIACLRILSKLWVSEGSDERWGAGQESHHCWLRTPRPTCSFSMSLSSSPNPNTVYLGRTGPCPSDAPFQVPVLSPDCHLCSWPTSRKPTTPPWVPVIGQSSSQNSEEHGLRQTVHHTGHDEGC